MSEQPTAASNSERLFSILTGIVALIALLFVGGIILDRNRQEPANSAPKAESAMTTRGSDPRLTTAGIFFDLSETAIPPEEILPGGPAKDGIPAITDPKLVAAEQADYLVSADRVVGVVYDGIARAYPLSILTQHELVNDTVGNQAVAITYCPLCDSALAFDRLVGTEVREFGISGLLYNSNVLLYDRSAEESLWSQMMQQGVTGAAMNTELALLPLELTTWGQWRSRHPETQVLSNETGFSRDYEINPYAGYFASDDLMFPMKETSDRLPLKTPVLGIVVGDQTKAYPVTAFDETHRTISDQLGEGSFEIEFDPLANSLRVIRADDGVRWAYAYWFAWYGFHTDTEVYAP